MKPVTRLRHTAASLALCCVMAGALITGAGAQEISDEHVKIAKQAMRAIGSTSSLDNILPGIAGATKTNLIQNRPDLQAEITEIVDNTAIELAPRRGDLEKEIARVYARSFSIEELKQIAEFYNGDTGKKLLSQTPIVFRSIENAAKVWRVGLGRDFNEKVAEKIKKAGLE